MTSLSELMERRGLTVTDLARKAGVTVATIHKYDDGSSESIGGMRVKTAYALADALGVGVLTIIGPARGERKTAENAGRATRNRLRALREKAGLSQPQVAKKMGVWTTAYSRFESGERDASRMTLSKAVSIARVLRVAPEEILGEAVAGSGDGWEKLNSMPRDERLRSMREAMGRSASAYNYAAGRSKFENMHLGTAVRLAKALECPVASLMSPDERE